MHNEFFDGPFLSAALLCEKVLREHDDVITAVRLVDRFTLSGADLEVLQSTPIEIMLFVNLKSGRRTGKGMVTLDFITPSGEGTLHGTAEVEFRGDKPIHAVNIIAPLSLTFSEGEGIYWLDVRLDGHMMTRIPIGVEYRSD